MRYLSLFVALVCSMAAIAENRAEALRRQLFNPNDGRVMVVVHRGDWRYAPENSLAAIEHCIDMGADIVELDLQMTKDSVLVVMHDTKLDRTTNGKGEVADKTMAELRKLYLKSGCGIKTKHRIPTLEEAMLVAKGKVLVNLDKADKYFAQLLPVLRRTGTACQVIMKSNYSADEVISTFGPELSEVIYMPKVNLDEADSEANLAEMLAKLKAPIVELKYSTESTLNNARRGSEILKGKARMWYNTLWDTQCGGHDDEVALRNPDAAYGFLIDSLGCNVLQTDRAQLLLDYLRRRGRHD